MLNDTHHTDGFNYRTPGEPLMINALGRALWNFLNLEEALVAIFYEAGRDMETVRKEMPKGKENKLEGFKNELKGARAPQSVIEALEKAIAAFSRARENYRNALTHARPYTVGYDEEGRYLPGLVASIGKNEKGAEFSISNSKHLHDMANGIEKAIDPISLARSEVAVYFKSKP